MHVRLREEYNKQYKQNLVNQFKYSTIMQVPKLEKIVLNVGMGEAHSNPNLLNSVLQELGLITGQKPVKTVARKSIANFKIREGYDVGARVTLRGDKMYEFLERLINIALPRVRDFKGLSSKSFDTNGNYNFSIMEQIIFPEINFDKTERIHGINITIVTTAKTKEEAFALLKEFKMPFKEQG